MQIVEHSVVGTRSAVLRLRRPGTELQFVVFPMFHVAAPEFYAEVSERLRRCDLVVVEGVSGRSAVGWALTSTYRVIPANKRSGLVQDPIAYGSLGVPLVHPDVTAGEFERSWRRLPLRTRLQMWLLMPVVAVLQLFGGRRMLLSPEVELGDLPTDLDDHELVGVFRGERDERLLAALYEIHEERSAERIDVAVVYGAGHTAAIVHGLLSRYGYRPRSSEWLTVVAPGPARSVPVPASTPKVDRVPQPGPGPVRTGAAQDVQALFVRVALARRMAAGEPLAYQPKLATALDALMHRLGDLDRREEAMLAADELVDVYEDLAERYPGAYRTSLAMATSDLAVQLAHLGRQRDALVLDGQAVELLRGAHPNDPAARADSLGHALTNFAVSLSRFGRDDEALAAAREAAELYGEAGHRPDAYSRALTILANRLEDMGAVDEARATAARAAAAAGDVSPS